MAVCVVLLRVAVEHWREERELPSPSLSSSSSCCLASLWICFAGGKGPSEGKKMVAEVTEMQAVAEAERRTMEEEVTFDRWQSTGRQATSIARMSANCRCWSMCCKPAEY